jgi:hypothetical protein
MPALRPVLLLAHLHLHLLLLQLLLHMGLLLLLLLLHLHLHLRRRRVPVVAGRWVHHGRRLLWSTDKRNEKKKLRATFAKLVVFRWIVLCLLI